MHVYRCQDLVSVLFPVFSPDLSLLEEALDSVLNQDYQHLEVVVVEDPSPKTGREVIESFDDPRIRYFPNECRTSLLDQLNQGIALCLGEFIARMDADDVSMPSRMGKQLVFLKENPDVSVVGANIEAIDPKDRSLGYRRYPETHADIARAMRIYCPMAHPSVMFRKADVVAVGGYREPAPIEDWDLWCRLLKAGRKFHNLQEVLLRYRIHPGAGKARSVRKTLLTGIEIKERHFKGVPGAWGFRERLRCALERLLLLMPAQLVISLFLLRSFRQNP